MKINKNFDVLETFLAKDDFFEKAQKKLVNNKKVILNNVNASVKSVLAWTFFKENNDSLYIICEKVEDCIEYLNDIKLFIGDDSIATLFEPPRHIRSHLVEEKKDISWMVEGISKIINKDRVIGIADASIFNKKFPNVNKVIENQITIKKGQNKNFENFINDLISNGFSRKDYVAEQGEIAIRGGIIDIFPVNLSSPMRIEFWGDEIESIREFDPLSQRSIKDHDEIDFLAKYLRNEKQLDDTSFFDLIKTDDMVFLDQPEIIATKANLEFSNLDNKLIFINSIERADHKIKSITQKSMDSSVKEFTKELIKLRSDNKEIHVCAESRSHIDRLISIIESGLENDLDYTLDQTLDLMNGVRWHDKTFSKGFEFNGKLWVFTEHEIFGRQRIPEATKTKVKSSMSIRELNSLKIGDLVVHEDKGLARFEGFRTITIGESHQDCVQLAFDGGDRLFVNMNFINKIQKYSAQEDAVPKLSKLGSKEWIKKRSKTKKKLKDIARELIKLYAKRKMEPGYAFPTDTSWQKEFEASFLYDDTIDQLKATEEIKEDMEIEKPMDRLLCGDVGFGKTEVAMRAAFKAVESGKQVAVLVPTTVLAQQHFMTFKDRLNRYPINVEVLNRFVPRKKQTEALSQLKTGEVDILIGTHRILSKDIEFKDLGLLVIDEEQRFGVSAKEKLRQMRVSIDTLTLTATPIPRTLNFSLMGARDLSVIETPPKNRLPVYTEILEWDADIVVEAIEKEINRGGQVFFVSDKVEDLQKMMLDLKMMMPSYNFGLAHGQMKGNELEKAMQDFISGKTDVLVTTKIVESGLDIPNANTMIINRANNFGLAELYQLRGRVGRTNTQAYCYLLIPKASKINKTALKRLQAIEEFTDLGSGFQLALRDMEIRGAGNLLGAEQSGLIYDIGFELYQKVLDEAVRELKTEEFSDLFEDESSFEDLFKNDEVGIEINEDALIPEDYIETDTERFAYYKKLYSLRKIKELNEIREEFQDRFGKIPQEIENLLFVVKLRIRAIPTGFSKVVLKQNKMVCEFPDDSNVDYYQNAFPAIMDLAQTFYNSKIVQGRKKLFWEIPIKNKDEAVEILWKISKALEFVDV